MTCRFSFLKPRLRINAAFLGMLLFASQTLEAQSVAGKLVEAARIQLEALNTDSAATLLVQALDPRNGASTEERVRALVLRGIIELIPGRPDEARRLFREALTLEPTLRVDSLAELHAFLLTTFDAERTAMAMELAAKPAVPQARMDSIAVATAPRVDADSGLRAPATGEAPSVPSEPPGAARDLPARPRSSRRGGPWEVSVLPAALILDQELRVRLEQLGAPTGGRVSPGAGLRLGYNFNKNLGVSAAALFTTGQVTTIAPAVSVVYTMDLNRRVSPYFILGAGLTQYQTDYGTNFTGTGGHAGFGVRSFFSDNLAWRVEGRFSAETYESFFTARRTAFNGLASAGLSYFMGSRGR